MESIEEIIEVFSDAELLYEEIQDLSKRETKHMATIGRNIDYQKALKDKRYDVSRFEGLTFAKYKGINEEGSIAYEDFKKLFDYDNTELYDQLKNSVIKDIIKVKAVCQKLNIVEPWLIKFNLDNYQRMNDYLKQYESCPIYTNNSYDKSKCVDENFRIYLNRIQEDLKRAIDVIPIMYHHLDNTKITLEQKGVL